MKGDKQGLHLKSLWLYDYVFVIYATGTTTVKQWVTP